jgi:hypothetical protein
MQEGTVTTQSVRQVCEVCFDAYQNDCSGFAKAVASALNVPLQGLANEIVGTLRASQEWTPLHDGVAAAESAKVGKLVIGGLKGSEQFHPDPNGHVVVVVDGPLHRNAYPCAYWGSLGGNSAKDKTINYAWRPEDRDRVSYAAHDIPAVAALGIAGASATAAALRTTLRVGSSGEQVAELQSILAKKKLVVSADGQFGPATAAAVEQFQTSQGLPADGVVGPQTWDALTRA